MWINWPCSDNDKNVLHMGGHNVFLGSGLEPGQVEGIVINPMQQSEPSKQGIFMTADYTWNLWGPEHADDVWEQVLQLHRSQLRQGDRGIQRPARAFRAT